MTSSAANQADVRTIDRNNAFQGDHQDDTCSATVDSALLVEVKRSTELHRSDSLTTVHIAGVEMAFVWTAVTSYRSL